MEWALMAAMMSVFICGVSICMRVVAASVGSRHASSAEAGVGSISSSIFTCGGSPAPFTRAASQGAVVTTTRVTKTLKP